jgi:hypothetical protein
VLADHNVEYRPVPDRTVSCCPVLSCVVSSPGIFQKTGFSETWKTTWKIFGGGISPGRGPLVVVVFLFF